METQNEINRCLNCGKDLQGRSDKLYCSIQCKNAFNNSKNKNELELFKTIDKQLHRNRNVLKKFYDLSIEKDFIGIRPLLFAGFDSSKFTGYHQNDTSREKYYIVYDYVFLIDSSLLKIKIYKRNG